MPAYLSFLTALGWSLLESIWQMAVIWTSYFILTAGNKRFSAAGKHNLAILFVVLGSEWFFYTFIQLLKKPTDPIVTGFIPISDSANRWIPILSVLYLLILLSHLIKYGFQYFDRRKNKSEKSISPALQSFADRYARLLGITKRVHVYLSGLAQTAETSGFLKPLILLPVSLVTRLTPRQVEAILVHELFHIRRNDYLVNICMSCFRRIFFFNPFAHLFYTAVARERELACDDGVLENGYEPALYAEALYNLEKFRQVQPGFSLSADGNKPWLLMERIRRVLGKPIRGKNRFNPLIFFSLLTASALFGLQQKNYLTKGVIPVAVNQLPVIPTRYESVQEKIKGTEKIIVVKSTGHRKPIKKQTEPDTMPPAIPEAESAEVSVALDQAYFAENNIVRNYSNQQASGTTRDPIQGFPGTPYVPSVSLSYEALPEILAADNIRFIEMENGIKDIVINTRIKKIAILKTLEAEIEKSRNQLKEIEIKTGNSFYWISPISNRFLKKCIGS